MLLLNAVRALIILLGVLLGYTFQLAYGLTGVPLIMVSGVILFLGLCAIEISDAKLIAYFNPEEKPRG